LLRPTSENYLNQTASIDFKVNNNGIVNENTQICVAVRYSGIYNNYRACLNVDH
jgi:hypothetical protein